MRKNVLFFSGIAFLILFNSFARATELSVTTDLPPGSLSVKVSKVDSKGTDASGDDTWTSRPDTALSFGELKEVKGTDPVTGSWSVMLPADNSFYAIDCGLSGGGVDSGKSISVRFDPGTPDDILGERLIVSYVKVTVNSDGSTSDSPLIPEKKLLKDPRVVKFSDVQGGWLRLYIGVNNGKSGVAGAKTFSSADPAGNYSGDVVISMF